MKKKKKRRKVKKLPLTKSTVSKRESRKHNTNTPKQLIKANKAPAVRNNVSTASTVMERMKIVMQPNTNFMRSVEQQYFTSGTFSSGPSEIIDHEVSTRYIYICMM